MNSGMEASNFFAPCSFLSESNHKGYRKKRIHLSHLLNKTNPFLVCFNLLETWFAMQRWWLRILKDEASVAGDIYRRSGLMLSLFWFLLIRFQLKRDMDLCVMVL